MNDENLKKTPLYNEHIRLGARMVPFAGFHMPVQYVGVLSEVQTVRENIGLFDVSHMGQFSVRGKEALTALNKLVTNDLARLKIGQAQYNILCNEKGNTLDDIIVYNRADEHVYICVNASNIEKDFNWLRSHLPQDLSLEDESSETALIAVQGPQAEALVSQASEHTTKLKYYWATETTCFGIPCYLSRTGYTGEDGFEIYVHKHNASSIWKKLLEAGQPFQTRACGLGARDTLRIEMGYALYGHELTEEISPITAGLSWVVKLTENNPFIGKEVLANEKKTGPKQILKAFRIQDRRIPRQGYSILGDSKQPIGVVTSGTFSPQLNAPVALGFIKSDADSLSQYFIEVRNQPIEAQLVGLPFVPGSIKKNK